jgi:hypothetical protein
VALADSGRAQDQGADLALDEPQRAQLGEALGVQGGLEGDVELVERATATRRRCAECAG